MVTTIQVHEKLKKQLESLKQERESYEDVIFNLIKETERQKRTQTAFLIESYKEMSKESLKVTKEWSSIDKE